MKLHESVDEFRSLIALTAQYKHIPESAVLRDYYIPDMLAYQLNWDVGKEISTEDVEKYCKKSSC